MESTTASPVVVPRRNEAVVCSTTPDPRVMNLNVLLVVAFPDASVEVALIQ
jgi:hypothetical protein